MHAHSEYEYRTEEEVFLVRRGARRDVVRRFPENYAGNVTVSERLLRSVRQLFALSIKRKSLITAKEPDWSLPSARYEGIIRESLDLRSRARQCRPVRTARRSPSISESIFLFETRVCCDLAYVVAR